MLSCWAKKLLNFHDDLFCLIGSVSINIIGPLAHKEVEILLTSLER
jgi:hypothetical protein